jgi:3',5'-cyclic AMP phosphodiesterase CpdA
VTTILTKLAVFFLAVLMFFSSPAPIRPYEVGDSENLRLSFAAISDTHLQGNNQKQARQLIRGLRDMEAAAVQPDALLIAGDLTMNGQNIEYFFLNSVLGSEFKTNNLLLAAGNHDICIKENDYTKAQSRFTSNLNKLTGRDIDKVYYATVIDGYYFLVLGSESIAGTEQTFSQAQLDWLDYMLTLAAQNAPGKPVFVMNHNPLKGTNNVDTRWPDGGSAGEQSDEIMAILQRYNNVFFFSGHLHAPYDSSGVTQVGNVFFVDLPAFHEGESAGIGYIVEVYEGRVVLRARNFAVSQWKTLEFIVALV